MHSHYIFVTIYITNKGGGLVLKEISFIHAADLHIDSPFQGLSEAPNRIFKEIRESTFLALDKLVHTAIEKEVDFVLLVGDLFDHEIQSLKAQIRLRQAFEKLARHHIDVFLSYGNHDYLSGNVHSVSFPDNVHVFPSEKVQYIPYKKSGESLAHIYGFSYVQRVIKENKAKEYKVENPSVPFHIATLHGSIKSNKDHDVYAPFTIGDLRRESFDYWALGHIHKAQELDGEPPIVYAGNTQGRHRLEDGEKGCYHVTLSEKGAELEFIPLQAIKFQAMKLDLKSYGDMYEAKQDFLDKLTRATSNTPLLIDLTVKNSDTLAFENEEEIAEFLELVHEETVEKRLWQYVFRLELEEIDHDRLTLGEHFISELLKQFEHLDVSHSLEDLLGHRLGKKHIQSFTDEEKERIKDKSEAYLLKSLQDKG